MVERRVSLLNQPLSDLNTQRVQDNSAQAIKSIGAKLDLVPILISEKDSGEDKIYNDGVQYEIFHNLGKVCKAISVAYCTSHSSVFYVEDSNPLSLDRTKYVRVSVYVFFGGSSKLKFWVS